METYEELYQETFQPAYTDCIECGTELPYGSTGSMCGKLCRATRRKRQTRDAMRRMRRRRAVEAALAKRLDAANAPWRAAHPAMYSALQEARAARGMA